MSVPARKVAAPAPAPRLQRAPAPRPSPKAPARPQTRPRPSTTARSRPRARRWRHPAFFLFAGIVVSVMIMGLVALNALLVQTTYGMQTVRQQVSDLSVQQVQLTDQVATLSSPENVARWAREHDLTMPAPGDTIVLPVPGIASANDAGRVGG